MATWDKEKKCWRGIPIKYCFVNPSEGEEHPAKEFTEVEKKCAAYAIDEWNKTLVEDYDLERDAIREAHEGEDCDITLRWEDDSFFKDWRREVNGKKEGLDLSGSTAWADPPGGEALEKIEGDDQTPWTPDRNTDDFPVSEIYFNLSPSAPSIPDFNREDPWFVDPTPEDDDEFIPKRETVGEHPDDTSLWAREGSAADGRIDFYTIVKHEFGHMLGLGHNGEAGAADDRGEVMRKGVGGGERRHYPRMDEPRLGERRHLTDKDIEQLHRVYDEILAKKKWKTYAIILVLLILLAALIIIGLI